jgi:general secretion pathway protein L
MKPIAAIRKGFWQWLDRVAEDVAAFSARVATPRTIQLVEEEPGQFAVLSVKKTQAAALHGFRLRIEDGAIVDRPPPQVEAALRGSRVELLLRPGYFVFKPLDLPTRAAEFLEGVVRAQIDRLTPWNAEVAAYGFSKPVDVGAGRLAVTVAATAKPILAPFVRAFAPLGARRITISTRLPEASPTAPAIAIMEENVAGLLDMRRARRVLLAVLGSCSLAAATAAVSATIIVRQLDIRQAELARRIIAERSAALTARNAPGDPLTAAERALAKRKNQTPSAVIALEVLSRILPDHTYVTELRIEADKLRVTGITDDAPRLIRLMEQTPHFAQATFFAPITRSPSDTGDRFDIEARIEPVFLPLP